MVSIDTFVQRFDLTAAICWLLLRPPRLIAGNDTKLIRVPPESCSKGALEEAERRWRESKTATYATGLEFSKAMDWLRSRIALPGSNGVEFYKYFGALEVSRVPDPSIVAVVAPKLQEFDNEQRRRSLWSELLNSFPYLAEELQAEIDREWAVDIYRAFGQLRNRYEDWDESDQKPDAYTLQLNEAACGRELVRAIEEGAISEHTPVVAGAWWQISHDGAIELILENGDRRIPVGRDRLTDDNYRGVWGLAVDTWLGPHLPSIVPAKGSALKPSEQNKYQRGASACTMIAERIIVECRAGKLVRRREASSSTTEPKASSLDRMQLDLDVRAHIFSNPKLYTAAGMELDRDYSPEVFFQEDYRFATCQANYPGSLPTLEEWLPVTKRVSRVVSELQSYLHAVKGLPSVTTAAKVLLIHWILIDEGSDSSAPNLTKFQDWSVGEVPHVFAHAGAYELTVDVGWIECVKKSWEVLRRHTVAPRSIENIAEVKPNRARQKRKWLTEAMLIVSENPELTDTEIAGQVGRSPGTLSRNKVYKAAAQAARQRSTMKGIKSRDRDGRTSVDGVVDNDD